ncbi:MAG: hypothetical protein BWY42_00466 [Candidatus Omnitrophica bacterium ADurb.Bin277]|nr:MAG: hypothetical protein BWY42_00466 [Candidatus Omnitrophica bacterium ADurb.Bin277]
MLCWASGIEWASRIRITILSPDPRKVSWIFPISLGNAIAVRSSVIDLKLTAGIGATSALAFGIWMDVTKNVAHTNRATPFVSTSTHDFFEFFIMYRRR